MLKSKPNTYNSVQDPGGSQTLAAMFLGHMTLAARCVGLAAKRSRGAGLFNDTMALALLKRLLDIEARTRLRLLMPSWIAYWAVNNLIRCAWAVSCSGISCCVSVRLLTECSSALFDVHKACSLRSRFQWQRRRP